MHQRERMKLGNGGKSGREKGAVRWWLISFSVVKAFIVPVIVLAFLFLSEVKEKKGGFRVADDLTHALALWKAEEKKERDEEVCLRKRKNKDCSSYLNIRMGGSGTVSNYWYHSYLCLLRLLSSSSPSFPDVNSMHCFELFFSYRVQQERSDH